MPKQSKLLQIRFTEQQHRDLVKRAESEGLTVSNLVRRELGMDPVKGRGRFPREPVQDEPAEQEPRVLETVELSLAERRERRAKQLAVTMPLRNARQLAVREIPE